MIGGAYCDDGVGGGRGGERAEKTIEKVTCSRASSGNGCFFASDNSRDSVSLCQMQPLVVTATTQLVEIEV